MKGSSGILLIALGLIMLYVVLSDKYSCFTQFFDCLRGEDYKTIEGYTEQGVATISKSPPSATGSMFDLLKGILIPGVMIPH